MEEKTEPATDADAEWRRCNDLGCLAAAKDETAVGTVGGFSVE